MYSSRFQAMIGIISLYYSFFVKNEIHSSMIGYLISIFILASLTDCIVRNTICFISFFSISLGLEFNEECAGESTISETPVCYINNDNDIIEENSSFIMITYSDISEPFLCFIFTPCYCSRATER